MLQRHIRSLAGALLAACVGLAAQAAPVTYSAALSGANESPPNASPGTGLAFVTLDTAAHTLLVNVTFSGLTGTTTVSHVHCCTAVPGVANVGVATALPSFPGFPVGVTSGSYLRLFDTTLTSSWGTGFITANGGTPLGAEAAFASGLAEGRAYLNVHSTFAPGGEIRGFLAAVPEPASLALVSAGLLGFGIMRRRGAG